MTNRELNRDVKRLAKVVKGFDLSQNMTDAEEQSIKKEIRRLYYADDKFEILSKNTALLLLRINLRFRAIPLHVFGLQLDI